MYYVYVLFNKEDNKFYIGYTQNLERRIQEHEIGGNHTTLRFKNLEFIFCENFICKEDAQRREKYFKTTKGRKALRLMLRDTLAAQSKNRACPVV